MAELTNILLVEDNVAHVELIVRSFDSSLPNCKINVCSNIKQANNVISSQPPQVIITDLNLPDGKGLELLSTAEHQPYPLILMTSYGDENIAVETIKSGAYDYIVKSPEAFESMPRSAERVYREWMNITNTLRIQNKLIYKEQEQAEILNSITDGVITTNETGTILSFNNSAESIFGLSSSEAIGNNIDILMHSSTQDMITDKNLKTSGSIITEVVAKHKSDKIFPIRLSIIELSKDANGHRRFINTCHDLSHEKQQAEQLRRSLKMEALGKLTGGITHDYNNMLSVVLGYSELLTNLLADEPVPARYVSEIRRACERSAQLTKKLLSFSKHKNSDATTLNINTMLVEQQDMLMRTLTARIALKLELENNLWNIIADNNDLADAILNICINAMHAIEDQGHLTIETSNTQLDNDAASLLELPSGDYVTLSITDTGCGMDDATKDRIFDPFYTTKGENGTGLGLSQVYGFIERSKGAINIKSECDRGSTFTLYFRRHSGNTDQKNHPVATNENYNGNETILLVDDESALLNLTTEILRKSGYTVLKTTSPNHALKLLESNTVSLMLSDVIMPEMDGYELAGIVRNKYPEIKIQLASGYSEADGSGIYNDELQETLLLKPYTVQELLKTVRNLLDQDSSAALVESNNA